MAQAQEHLERGASEVLCAWYDAWNTHDADAVSALIVDDVRYEDPAAPQPVMLGRAAVGRYVAAAFRALPDLHLEKLEEWTSEGEEIIVSQFRITASFRDALVYPGRPKVAPTGARIDALGMDRSEIRDGLLARHQIFWDQAEVWRQTGLLPPRGSTAEKIVFGLQRLAARRRRGS